MNSRRSAPLSPHDRRRELVDVTVQLVRERHEVPSTRDIAAAAGIAEGTIFRAFDTKDALLAAVVGAVACPVPLRRALEGVDPQLPLRERTELAARLLMRRFAELFDLLGPLGVMGPPPHHPHPDCPEPEARIPAAAPSETPLARLFAADADRLRLPPSEFAHVLRLLAFAGGSRHVAEAALTPESVRDLLLDGALLREGAPPLGAAIAPTCCAGPAPTTSPSHPKENPC